MPVRALLILLTLLNPLPATAGAVTVFAAISLSEALAETARAFTEATGHTVTLSLAGSSALARQIEAGAPADIFVSASPAWMDMLQAQGRLAPGTRFDLAGNTLVVIAPAPAGPLALPDLAARLGSGRLALALTDAVPAGLYAREALETLGLWDALAPHLAETDNVRAALALVALRAAPFGIVYATDAAAEPRVAVRAAIPPETHAPIRYPAAAIADRDSPAASAFLSWLHGPRTRAALARAGFTDPAP